MRLPDFNGSRNMFYASRNFFIFGDSGFNCYKLGRHSRSSAASHLDAAALIHLKREEAATKSRNYLISGCGIDGIEK
jgi:hypothetical protein